MQQQLDYLMDQVKVPATMVVLAIQFTDINAILSGLLTLLMIWYWIKKNFFKKEEKREDKE